MDWKNLFNKNSRKRGFNYNNNNNNNNNDKNKKAAFYIAGLLAVGMGAYMVMSGGEENTAAEGGPSLQNPNGISYNKLLEEAQHRHLSGVAVMGNSIIGTTRYGEYYVSSIPYKADPLKDFNELNTPVTNIPVKSSTAATSSNEGSSSPLNGFMGNLLVGALMIGAMMFFMNRMQGGGGRPGAGGNAFGKSKAKLLQQKEGRVTFDDVAGADHAKKDLEETIEFLRNPQKFNHLGGKIPKGTLLEGPPGTGKTLLARAVAGESGVPFYQVSGSDFVEMFVGVGASRVRDMFAEAKKNAPCIVFIDEIDAVGRARGQGHGGGNDEREQTLNQLLVEMDGFEANEGVILMAATNRRDVLDPALLRPGRFDRKVVVPNPDLKSREAILGVHIRKVPLADDVNLRDVARNTPGFSGADLANLVNEAALHAARKERNQVTMFDFDEARDKVLMGDENRTLELSDDTIHSICRHEAGHAVLAMHFYLNGKRHDPVYKATRIPRGQALGMVVCVPESDRVSMNHEEYEAKIVMTMAGRAAERITHGEKRVSSGPQMDIQQASRIARDMVMKFGMSELGSVDYGDDPRNPYKSTMSPETQREIDQKVMEIVKKAEDEAYQLIKPAEGDEAAGPLHETWVNYSQALWDHETLNFAASKRIMDGMSPFEPKPEPEEIEVPKADNNNDPSANDFEDQQAIISLTGIPHEPKKPQV